MKTTNENTATRKRNKLNRAQESRKRFKSVKETMKLIQTEIKTAERRARQLQRKIAHGQKQTPCGLFYPSPWTPLSKKKKGPMAFNVQIIPGCASPLKPIGKKKK